MFGLRIALRNSLFRRRRLLPLPARCIAFQTPILPGIDSTPPPLPNNKDIHELLMQLLELPTRESVKTTFGSKEGIFNYNAQDVINSFEQLRLLNYKAEEIRQYPTILLRNALTISNHNFVLREAGFTNVELRFLYHYVLVLNKTIQQLKVLYCIPSELNVPYKLAGYLHLDIQHLKFNEQDKVKDVRHILLNEFLKTNFDVPEEERKRIYNTYPNIRHKSFACMFEALQLLTNELGMSKERIMQHAYVLATDPENLRNILSEPTLGGINTKELLWRRPKIIMSNYQSLMKVQEHIRTFNVPDSAVPRCIEVFTLSPDTVYERLSEMRKIKEFSVLVNHPRVLRLVHYKSKALSRLEFLRKMKVNCVSLHILSSCADYFDKYTKTGVDRTKGTDIVLFLSTILKRSCSDLRLTLNRHPNWCHVPCVSVKLTLEYLQKRGFSLESINDNIYLLLYPLKRIEEQMKTLKKAKDKFDVGSEEMTEHQQLQMCLYLIEREFHFAGDGIWISPMPNADFAGADSQDTEIDMLESYTPKSRPTKKVISNVLTDLQPDVSKV